MDLGPGPVRELDSAGNRNGGDFAQGRSLEGCPGGSRRRRRRRVVVVVVVARALHRVAATRRDAATRYR